MLMSAVFADAPGNRNKEIIFFDVFYRWIDGGARAMGERHEAGGVSDNERQLRAAPVSYITEGDRGAEEVGQRGRLKTVSCCPRRLCWSEYTTGGTESSLPCSWVEVGWLLNFQYSR
ncbi:hypothetical protein DPX16_12656 [Anabarilius grahami]|uniref:Uncharacterized protein n=1 Tax=Anabarilius grahami TaxID=495550 RepID=A0A3N0YKS5_ANAGA|nr:hypothetical protein DPX16_12656 [Anabarilius grahami]